MKNFILDLLKKWACSHDWKIFDESRTFEKGSTRPYAIHTTVLCEKCGKFKKLSI